MRYELELTSKKKDRDQIVRVKERKEVSRKRKKSQIIIRHIKNTNKVLMMDSHTTQRMLEKTFARRVNIGRKSSKMTFMRLIQLEN